MAAFHIKVVSVAGKHCFERGRAVRLNCPDPLASYGGVDNVGVIVADARDKPNFNPWQPGEQIRVLMNGGILVNFCAAGANHWISSLAYIDTQVSDAPFPGDNQVLHNHQRGLYRDIFAIARDPLALIDFDQAPEAV